LFLDLGDGEGMCEEWALLRFVAESDRLWPVVRWASGNAPDQFIALRAIQNSKFKIQKDGYD